MDSIAELTIKDFRSVKSAEIELNGITVVSGINGCGKSTISKVLYYALKCTNDFEELVLSELNEQLQSFYDVLQQLDFYIYKESRRRTLYPNSKNWGHRMHIYSVEQIPLFMNYVKLICKTFEDFFSKGVQKTPLRLNYMLLDVLKNAKEEDNIGTLLEKMRKQIGDILQKSEQNLQTRPSFLLKKKIFEEFKCFPKFSLSEYGETVIDQKIQSIPYLHNIKKVLYIDTPMAIGLDISNNLPIHWNDLNTKMREPAHRGYSRKINAFIKDRIIKGDSYYDDKDFMPSLKFKSSDGFIFDLTECATGIKSFSAIQILLKNRFLDKETLLILDEPEAHLHPQWIVEYARLLVLLNKIIGVKLFIASHSTDMVSSLRYIAEKEEMLNRIVFYMAENDQTDALYFRFKKMGIDIEPIFHSFNKSLDKLELYVE